MQNQFYRMTVPYDRTGEARGSAVAAGERGCGEAGWHGSGDGGVWRLRPGGAAGGGTGGVPMRQWRVGKF